MRILKVAAVLAAAMCMLCACGDSSSGSLNYERPVNSLRSAYNYSDEETYLSCFLPQEKLRYTEAEDYTEGSLPLAGSKKRGSLSASVKEDIELDEKRLRELEDTAQKTYGVRFDFTKGRQLSVELKANGGELCETRELTVVRYENIWYIYGEVVDDLFTQQ